MSSYLSIVTLIESSVFFCLSLRLRPFYHFYSRRNLLSEQHGYETEKNRHDG